jgi:murein DD-endopeptidase MepM/ murein hydrolase activator NlpD
VRASPWIFFLLFVLPACTREAPTPRPQRLDVVLRNETETIEARVPPHATLDSLLREHQFPAALVEAAVAAVRPVFDLRQLRADRPYRLVRSLDGFLREFEYQIDTDRFLRIISADRAEPARLEAAVLPYEKETATVAVRGTIDSEHPSLIAAIDAAGEEIQLALSLAEIFGGEIDFESDLQPGDRIEVLVEKFTRDGAFAGYGPIVAARLFAERRERAAVRWIDRSTGKGTYYDADGRSLKRFMLRSPLLFQPRVTSAFSRSRRHPVFREYRAHLGVDYGAPVGSPVVAVADGVVVSAGWSGGGGNTIRLRHAGGLESYYLHLSAFGGGMRAGAHVSQGQVIGRVGATGTATGPHLDYRLRKNGVFVNPLVEQRRQPPGNPLTDAELPVFLKTRDTALAQLSATLLAQSAASTPDAITAASR